MTKNRGADTGHLKAVHHGDWDGSCEPRRRSILTIVPASSIDRSEWTLMMT